MKLNEVEQDAMDKVLAAHNAIMDLGLEYNLEELSGAIHTLQHFIMMHAAYRENPNDWNNWFESPFYF